MPARRPQEDASGIRGAGRPRMSGARAVGWSCTRRGRSPGGIAEHTHGVPRRREGSRGGWAGQPDVARNACRHKSGRPHASAL